MALPKVLFISYQFPPAGGPGVQRSTKFVQHLRSHGIEPVVVTIDTDGIKETGMKTDETLLEFIPEGTIIERLPSHQPVSLILWLNKLRIFRIFWYFLYPFFWERSARWPFRVFRKVKLLLQKHHTKTVYTTSAPYSSLILGYLLQKRAGAVWVADIRDPFTDGYQWGFPSKLHWMITRRLEKWLLSRADHIIVNTAEVKKLYVKRNIGTEETITVITNGF